MRLCFHTDVDIQPSVPNIPTLEGGGGGGVGGPGRPGGDGGTSNGGGGEGGVGGSGGGDIVGSGGAGGDGQVMVCIELASGNLQRNVTVNVMTISSPTSTGKQSIYIILIDRAHIHTHHTITVIIMAACTYVHPMILFVLSLFTIKVHDCAVQ